MMHVHPAPCRGDDGKDCQPGSQASARTSRRAALCEEGQQNAKKEWSEDALRAAVMKTSTTRQYIIDSGVLAIEVAAARQSCLQTDLKSASRGLYLIEFAVYTEISGVLGCPP